MTIPYLPEKKTHEPIPFLEMFINAATLLLLFCVLKMALLTHCKTWIKEMLLGDLKTTWKKRLKKAVNIIAGSTFPETSCLHLMNDKCGTKLPPHCSLKFLYRTHELKAGILFCVTKKSTFAINVSGVQAQE